MFMARNNKFILSSLFYCVVYAAGLLFFCHVISFSGKWYSPDPYHRGQVEAFLRGDLALSHDPRALDFDLCWSGGGVQQVWGLGVPIWQLPFDLAARLVGVKAFPDQFALTIFMSLAALLVIKTFLGGTLDFASDKPSVEDGLITSVGAISIGLIFPPFLSDLSAQEGIHSEVLAYTYLFGLMLACGMVAVLRRPDWRRYGLLCAVAGFGGLIRPTLIVYGVATIIPAAVGMWRYEKAQRLGPSSSKSTPARTILRLIAGAALFCIGNGILWGTNLIRFGDGFEFGHKLNLQDDALLRNIYAIRFDYPFYREPIWRAGRDLFGSLFRAPHTALGDAYASGIFPGQSPTFRWHYFSFATYGIVYFGLVVGGWLSGLCSWSALRLNRKVTREAALVDVALTSWSLLSCLGLVAFYLKGPFVASRYMIDFAPSFVAAIIVAWRGMVRAVPSRCGKLPFVRWIALACLIGWQGWEISQRDFPDHGSVTWKSVAPASKPRVAQAMPGGLPTSYKLGEDLGAYGIRFNGTGWNPRIGTLDACVILFVDSPQFLELQLTRKDNLSGDPAGLDCIRAKIGLELLKRRSIERTANGWRLLFEGPTRAMYKDGVQQVAIAMIATDALRQFDVAWELKQVSWRR